MNSNTEELQLVTNENQESDENQSSRKVIDWAAVEKDWRAGIKTKSLMAEEHGVSRAAMDKRFTKLKIPRDLNAKIQARAEQLVAEAELQRQVTFVPIVTTEEDSAIIEVNAQVQANSLIGHRKDIKRYRILAGKLVSEIEAETDDPALFHELAEQIIWKDAGEVQTKEEQRRMEQMQKLFNAVMSNPSRVDALKKLSEVMKTLIGLERQALGLSNNDVPDNGKNNTMRTIDDFYN